MFSLTKPIFIAALCAASMLLSARTNAGANAFDGDAVAQAKVLFDVGAKAYGQGNFAAAIQAFEQAQKLTPRPAILFSLAQAYRKQYYIDKNAESLKRALSAYREYLSQVPEGGRRVEAVEQVAVLEPIAERLFGATGAAATTGQAPGSVKTRIMISSSTEGALIAIDGDTPSPAPRFVETNAGKHKVVVTAPGHREEERAFELDNGAVFALDLTLKEMPSKVTVDTRSGAEISIDGRYVATAPLATPIDVASGVHWFTVSKNGHKLFSSEVPLDPGETATIAAPLDRTGQRIVSYALFAVGAGSFVTGFVYSGLATSSQSDAQRILATSQKGNADPNLLPDYDKALEKRTERAGNAFLAFSFSALTGIVGALLYSYDEPSTSRSMPPRPKTPKTPKEAAPSELVALPYFGPNELGASFSARF